MAKIASSANRATTFRIDRFLGVKEAPDGDTGLTMGEAAVMRNFRITSEGNLQIRPGYDTKATISANHAIRGMWHGNVAGTDRFLVACNGHIWNVNTSTWAATDLGAFTDAATHFFGFNSKVYLMNGSQYYSWDGTTFASVAGYVPIITIAAAPATGTGTANNQANKLIASYWIWYTGTGGTTVYHLPDTALTSVDSVYANGALKTVTTDYTVDLTAGTVTFNVAPGETVPNNVKIRYTKNTTATAASRALILAQKFSELYNGQTDNRIFLYGDGTNKAYYSGIEFESTLPTAEYFPDTNILNVGTSNTPITSLIRHFNKLMAFKTDGTFLIDYGTVTLDDASTTAAFFTRAIEKDIGHVAPAQVKLVNNYPISLHGNSAYRWGLVYTSGVQDERTAKRISDPVGTTLSGLTLASAVTFDDEYNREFWIVQGTTALIWNYSGEVDYGKTYKSNTWSIYTGIPATHFVQISGEIYFGTAAGTICHFDSDYRSDDGTDIDAYWESGSMAFGAEQMYKTLNEIYTVLKPDINARITMTLEADNKSDFDDRSVGSGVLNFTHIDFSHWSFLMNNKPQTRKTRIKAKKFVFLKLIFKSVASSATATVMTCTIPVTYTGLKK